MYIRDYTRDKFLLIRNILLQSFVKIEERISGKRKCHAHRDGFFYREQSVRYIFYNILEINLRVGIYKLGRTLRITCWLKM